jgi:hypothetical protein
MQVELVVSVMAPVERLTRAVGLAALTVALVLGTLAFSVARPIVTGLRALADRADRISRDDMRSKT